LPMSRQNRRSNSPANSYKKETAVQSVHRAAEILNCISNGISSVTEIAEKCALSKSTVHRLLKALGESELVMQDPINHQYFLGYSIIRLISTPLATQEYLTSCASEEMSRLSEVTGETVSLGIKMGMKSVNIHVITSKSDLKVDGANLRVRPVYVGVDGSVLLSQLDDYQVLNILNNIRRELTAQHGKIDREELMARIQLVRRQGYAVGDSALTFGVTCISAPVKNYAVPAVLNLVGPEIRMKPRLRVLTFELVGCATRISDKLKEWNNAGSMRC
jgi:IclR family KDG regulon transcriptional repressor